MLYPITLDLLASQFRVVECEDITPLPDKGRLMAALEVLLVSETIPLAFPVADGVKLTARVTYWPGARVTPCPIPEVMKPEPETVSCCSVSEPVPVLAKVAPSVVVAPVATSPKSTLESYMVRIADAGMEGLEGL